MTTARGTILVLGVGNPILCDDGFGIHAVRHASSLFSHPAVDFCESSLAGFGLLDSIVGYHKLLLLDAVNWHRDTPGTISILRAEDLTANTSLRNSHNLCLTGVLDLADQLGALRPREIVIIAVEAEDCTTFSERCTPAVDASIPEVGRMVVEQVKEWLTPALKNGSRARL